MLARVRRTIETRRLLERGDRVVVACSGGADSSVLVHVLATLASELGISLLVASVDHGLREESWSEVEAVGRFAASLGLEFEALRVDVRGASLQAAAREARYEALLGLAARASARRIAVGHTLDDQAETTLARLLRGAGLFGLGGVKPAREDGVIRPLIDATRAEVRAYALRHVLPTIEDPSNRDVRFQRVRIREDLLPRLTEEDPRVAVHLAELADEARDLAEQVGTVLDERLLGLEDPFVLPFERIRAADVRSFRRLLVRAWAERAIGVPLRRPHVVDLEALLDAPGEVWLPSSWVGSRGAEGLRLEHRVQRSGRVGRHTE
ncbi:MAG: tRNA lysidine(34) synthetase TilS [Polyangiales bacterium]